MKQPFFNLGLVGFPLGHSHSPMIHKTALKTCELQGDYNLYAVPQLSGSPYSLEAIIKKMRQGQIQGLNVTIPYKQAVMPFLDELTPTAQAIGAVNTIYRNNDRLIGDNTDAAGFEKDLSEFVPETPQSALVLGCGGAARAVIFSLAKKGIITFVAARRFEQISGLIEDLEQSFPGIKDSIHPLPIEADALANTIQEVPLIINTTPLGMHPKIDESPWPENVHFPAYGFVYDLVYNPIETKLLKDAKNQGLKTRSGLGMLIHQAVLAFEVWTGNTPLITRIEAMVSDQLLQTA
jgi:shikimate dehydrogenase